jgi:hypothetical protein
MGFLRTLAAVLIVATAIPTSTWPAVHFSDASPAFQSHAMLLPQIAFNPQRRRFLKLAAGTAAGAILLPGQTGVLRPDSHVFTSDDELSAAAERLRAGDPWTSANAASVRQISGNAARTLAVPDTFLYTNANVDRYANPGVHLAMAYRVQPELTDYRDLAKRILLAAANGFVPNSPEVTSNSSLDFSVGMIAYVHLFDLLKKELSAEEQALVIDRFFKPAAQSIMTNGNYRRDDLRRRSNIGAWHNAAVGTIGYATQDAALVTWALEGSGGFKHQIENGFGADKLWWEGSPRYQMYALAPLALLAEAAVHSGGEDLWSYRASNGNHLEMLYEGFFDIAEPNFRLPNINDQLRQRLPDFAALFEIAHKRNPQPTFADVLLQPREPFVYRSWTIVHEALRVTGRTPHVPIPRPSASRFLFPDLGWAIPRTGRGHVFGVGDYVRGIYKWSRFSGILGRIGTAHEHADKQSLTIDAFGQQLLADRDATDARHADYRRHTVAHNTIVARGMSQPGAAQAFDDAGASGSLSNTYESALVKLVQGRTDAAYNLYYHRSVMLVGDPEQDDPTLFPAYFFDAFRVFDYQGRPEQYDYVLHGDDNQRFAVIPSGQPFVFPETTNGYQYLANPNMIETDQAFSVQWEAAPTNADPAVGLKVHLQAGHPMQVIQAQAPGIAAGTSMPTLVVRRRQSDTTFVAVHEPYRRAPLLQSLPLTSDSYSTAQGRVKGPVFTDWIGLVHDQPERFTLRNPDAPDEYIVIDGRFGFVRQTPTELRIYGDVVEIHLNLGPDVRIVFGDRAWAGPRGGGLVAQKFGSRGRRTPQVVAQAS